MKDYAALLKLFSEHIDKHTSSLSEKHPAELYQPEAYILSLGGKRVRPLLALIACDLFDAVAQKALDVALAVELFHNFSLVHDDILDAAPLRRNKATVHVKWNHNIAILSGDVMLVKAFQCLESYESTIFKSLSILFNKTAIEVCEGQQLDMNFEKSDTVTVEDYLDMITLKTAVLLGCSLKMGAITAEAGEKDQENLYEFGKHLGISFQLLDDLLDAFAVDTEKFGKQIGGDILANKKTFLLLKAIELANPKQHKEIATVLSLSHPEEKIKRMLSIFNELNIKQMCEEEADKHTRIAIDCLEKINAPKLKIESLKHFALELLNRQI
ncbi:polyprenyl synthetase family protein [Aurantibacillus circumpalustris]|uniref:polyprenyl synthetase family protein n=1 Tax=Aurantibacillus circumpalustris TaxID=3036359 RepID=UPI00295AF426|nr:polyprenyl synthetase family protein [Aurantibacillus circumpalustris]